MNKSRHVAGVEAKDARGIHRNVHDTPTWLVLSFDTTLSCQTDAEYSI